MATSAVGASSSWQFNGKHYRGKTVFITGGASGLGQSLALAVVRAGASAVALFDLNSAEQSLELITQVSKGVKVAQTDGSSAQCQSFALNTTDAAAVKKAFAEAAADVGTPDLVFHCAGILRAGQVAEQDPAQFEQVSKVNVFGSHHVAQAAFPWLKQSQGQFVLIASMAGLVANYGYSSYACSKFATVGLGEILRYEWKPEGIGVTLVCPPEFPTPLLEQERDEAHPLTIELKMIAGVIRLEDCTKAIIKGVAKRKFLIIPSARAKLIAWSQRCFPSLNRMIADQVIARYFKSR